MTALISGSTSAAMLKLPSASARAHVVATGLLESQLCVFRRSPAHHVGWRTIRGQFGSHESHVQIHVVEEPLVSGAEVIQSRFSVGRSGESVLRALSITDKAHVTLAAIARKCRLFGLSETALLL